LRYYTDKALIKMPVPGISLYPSDFQNTHETSYSLAEIWKRHGRRPVKLSEIQAGGAEGIL